MYTKSKYIYQGNNDTKRMALYIVTSITTVEKWQENNQINNDLTRIIFCDENLVSLLSKLNRSHLLPIVLLLDFALFLLTKFTHIIIMLVLFFFCEYLDRTPFL